MPAMTSLPRRWLLLVLSLVAAASLAASEASPPPVVDLGNNTYRVTASATNKFTRNTDKLKATATEAATAFCAKLGKQLKIVGVEEKKSFYGVGAMASATLTFTAVDLAAPEVAASGPTPAPAAKSAAPLTNEELYADLLRLDELHKKGILTDDEFAAEKKKVLARSK
jgi:hypothetical protein